MHFPNLDAASQRVKSWQTEVVAPDDNDALRTVANSETDSVVTSQLSRPPSRADSVDSRAANPSSRAALPTGPSAKKYIFKQYLNAELDTTKNNHFDQVFKKGVKHKAIEILIASYIDEINDGLNKAKIFAPSKRGDNFQRADYFLNVQLFMYFKRPNFMNIFLDVLSEITEK